MSNYVYSKVICTEEFLKKYFSDDDPFGDGNPMEKPYITFNKLFGCKSLNEYYEKYGVYIDYGSVPLVNHTADGKCEVLFCDRWQYPIRAVIRSIELSHDVVWYCVEENQIYVSRFYWNDGVKEQMMNLESKEFYKLADDFEEEFPELHDPDCDVWHLLPKMENKWKESSDSRGLKRYEDTSFVDIDLQDPLRNNK